LRIGFSDCFQSNSEAAARASAACGAAEIAAEGQYRAGAGRGSDTCAADGRHCCRSTEWQPGVERAESFETDAGTARLGRMLGVGG
jgi:hypothetical protein